MSKIQKYDMYKIIEPLNATFLALSELCNDDIKEEKIIDWLNDAKKIVEGTEWIGGNEWFEIYNEHGMIALYDISDRMSDETISELDPLKRFEMSKKNFAEILYQWEELRVSRPDIILIIIHEDNHVSLEADPVIIKEYQDAGYAFDINKAPQRMKEYASFDKGVSNKYLSSFGLKSAGSQFHCLQEFISKIYFPDRPRTIFPNLKETDSIYKYHDEKNDMLYIGYYDELKGRYISFHFDPAVHKLGDYVSEEHSCKISTKNFIAFTAAWIAIEEVNSPFALIYRDQQDWVHCQAFQSQQAMEQFMVSFH